MSLAASAIGAAVFIGSGVYNIGADDHHTKPVLALSGTLRALDRRSGAFDRRTAWRTREDRSGAERYGALCVGCHLALG
jgi:hypothetical protein